MDQDFQGIYSASNRFGLTLLHAFARDGESQNIFFSPLSISMCLAIATNGANNQTRDEMQKALSLTGFSLDEINRANQSLISQFNVSEDDTDDEPELPPDPNDFRIRKRHVPRSELDNAYRIIDIVTNTADEKDVIAQLGEDYFAQMRAANLVMWSAIIDTRFNLSLANSLWVKNGVEFNPEYLAKTSEFYSAEVASLDFSDKTASDTINSWISRATQGVIPKIVDEISPGTMFVLANAIYFKAFWVNQFSKAKTKPEKFTLQNGEQIVCSMMYKESKFRYWEDADLQMIHIPYESIGERTLGMYIVLPKRPQDLNKLVSELSMEKWDSLIEQVHRQTLYGNLGLPRFDTEYQRELKDDLIALGMEAAFKSSADFSAMSTTALPLWISEVIHKAFIKVDEEGTEAGAATIVMMAGGKFSSEPEFQMIVDHPFIYAIRDHKSGILLFLGITMQPS